MDSRSRPDPIAYLDQVAASTAGRDYKQQVLELLDLHPGQTVLDIGCGPGTDLAAMATAVAPAGQVIGVDRDPVMIAEARSAGREPRAGSVPDRTDHPQRDHRPQPGPGVRGGGTRGAVRGNGRAGVPRLHDRRSPLRAAPQRRPGRRCRLSQAGRRRRMDRRPRLSAIPGFGLAVLGGGRKFRGDGPARVARTAAQRRPTARSRTPGLSLARPRRPHRSDGGRWRDGGTRPHLADASTADRRGRESGLPRSGGRPLRGTAESRARCPGRG
ncbi:methyltransferase domain-containing protein [Nonomuraea phyllanthi]|uniref:methyltransferase domain-containing protein n=1 Tax=Nonomuraea phyllanthi TaxID=2219224 RepID=UPI001D01E2C3